MSAGYITQDRQKALVRNIKKLEEHDFTMTHAFSSNRIHIKVSFVR